MIKTIKEKLNEDRKDLVRILDIKDESEFEMNTFGAKRCCTKTLKNYLKNICRNIRKGRLKGENMNKEINKLKENLPIKVLQTKHLISDKQDNKLILDFENGQHKKQISLMGTISLNEIDVLINALKELKNDYSII